MDAIEAIGGSRPLTKEEFARRAHAYALNPARNPLKEILDQHDSVEKTPPLLGGFNDVPWHKLREAEVHSWAKAGWSWIVNDAEHSQWEGWYGREQNAIESRHGILPVQRLAREARSEHGDGPGDYADALPDHDAEAAAGRRGAPPAGGRRRGAGSNGLLAMRVGEAQNPGPAKKPAAAKPA
ncbi:MAG: hypothetical protein QGH25_22535, partial [Candidatus Latescibacteria bacterium]|nr:hypothetical protein [Candidatus Latescibacterota bacterium]